MAVLIRSWKDRHAAGYTNAGLELQERVLNLVANENRGIDIKKLGWDRQKTSHGTDLKVSNPSPE